MSTSVPPRRKFRVPFTGRKKPTPQASIRADGSRDVEMPLIEHLRELRDRMVKAAACIILATVVSFIFVDQEVHILVAPARQAAGATLVALQPTEAFVSYVKVALTTGIAISMPLLVYQLFQFLAPGLTRREKRGILISLPGITLFFVLGLAFCYFVVLPSALGFLLNFGTDLIKATISISEYLSFVTTFMLAVGLAFETPLVVFILSKLGVPTPKRLSRFRRWFYVLAFIIAAIITPTPDPVNQTYVAVPLILLYELGIIFARIGARKPKAA